MALVTGFTAERMLEIENTTVTDGEVQGDNLILITREGTLIDAGSVRGPKGDVGPPVTRLDDIGDVNAPTPADKQVLGFNLATGMWVPSGLTLDDLTNVDATSPTNRASIRFNTTTSRWVLGPEMMPVIGNGAMPQTFQLNKTPYNIALADLTGTLQIGANGEVNIGMERNRIQCRMDGAPSTLYLQNLGGSVHAGSNLNVAGILDVVGALNGHSRITADAAVRDPLLLISSTDGPSITMQRNGVAGDVGLIGFAAGSDNLYISNTMPEARLGRVMFQVTPPAGTPSPVGSAGFQIIPNASSPNGMVLMSQATNNLTTANAANMFIHSSNYFFYRSTSSIEYKTDIETIDHDHAFRILELNPVWFRSLAVGDSPDWSFYGLVAEEVAEIDPRLVTWQPTPNCDCDYDPENPKLDMSDHTCIKPSGVQYDRIVPHLITVVRDHEDRLDSIEARLAALEAA